MKSSVLNKLRRRKRRILRRIENRPGPERERPMIAAHNIHYELGDRVQGLGPGGIGAVLLLARRTGLIADIDHYLHLIRRPAGRDLPGIDLPHLYDMIRACSHKLSLSLHRGGEPSWKGPSSALTP